MRTADQSTGEESTPATGLAVVAAWLVDRDDRTVDSGPAVDAGRTSAEGVEGRLDALRRAGALLDLARSGAAPERLAPGATVLEAEGVGHVEVGAPSAAMTADAPELVGGRCVAGPTSYACSYADRTDRSGGDSLRDRRPGRLPPGAGRCRRPTARRREGDGLGENAPRTRLPPGAALVEVEAGGQPTIGQVPLFGTAALPIAAADGETIELRVFAGDGSFLWADTVQLPAGYEAGSG